MTEDEAKTKACCGPAMVAAFVALHLPSADVAGSVGACAGSQCMAWRWQPDHNAETKIAAIRRHREEFNSELIVAKNYVEGHPEYVRAGVTNSGYCGLAGQP